MHYSTLRVSKSFQKTKFSMLVDNTYSFNYIQVHLLAMNMALNKKKNIVIFVDVFVSLSKKVYSSKSSSYAQCYN